MIDRAPSLITAPLYAGSTENWLGFTYKAPGIEMAGGMVWIQIPSDWTVSKKLMSVTDAEYHLYTKR